ncbi:hypothetical protein HaLaN_32842, partial [Haematococcus lacustris]
MFGMLWIYCRDLCAFESTEGSAATATAAAVPGNFIETKVEMGITPGMTAAAIVLSVFSPAWAKPSIAIEGSWGVKTAST